MARWSDGGVLWGKGMSETLLSKTIQVFLSNFSNPVSKFSLTYLSRLIDKDSVIFSLRRKRSRKRLLFYPPLRNTNHFMHVIMRPPYDSDWMSQPSFCHGIYTQALRPAVRRTCCTRNRAVCFDSRICFAWSLRYACVCRCIRLPVGGERKST